ncbi:hypothetical protein BKA58DRAFT_235794 [Alternaria rosae]|uniref:uncharacterized protein n=1 Tax=Alternaria rosae TaxID=1187941 RepID=UPI001E8DE419|nr:uncharacterized protein BKA58DRAFT_235794 [Alternaria rosae]KAH6864954.1 hypothetical protein BKA58DRAFT_235794 [Alternaria rosae]
MERRLKFQGCQWLSFLWVLPQPDDGNQTMLFKYIPSPLQTSPGANIVAAEVNVFITSDLIMTSQNTHSKFLQLPTELRLSIYSYALTNSVPVPATTVSINTNHGTIPIPKLYAQEDHHTRYSLETPKVPRMEFNQLRYVSHLLCQETRGLSLRHSDLVFMNEPGTATPAREICARFLEIMPVSAQARIRQMTLIEGSREEPLAKLRISRNRWYKIGQLLTGGEHPVIYSFCRANPAAKVILRLDTRRVNKLGREMPHMGGNRYTLLHASLRLLLRDSSAVEQAVEEAMKSTNSISRYHEMMLNKIRNGRWRLATYMIPDIRMGRNSEAVFRGALLENFRVTICRWFRNPAPFAEMEDEWFAAVRREFEEGC